MTNKPDTALTAGQERAKLAGSTPDSFWNGEMPDAEREKWIEVANLEFTDHQGEAP